MPESPSFLYDKKIGVVGFNARPITASLKRLGAKTFVSDYWGDQDLAKVSDHCIAVLNPLPGIRQRQPLEVPLHQALLDNFHLLTKEIDLDYIVIGSGFDDNSETLIPLYKEGILAGSDPKKMKQARDLSYVKKFLTRKSCHVPKRANAHSIDELLEKSQAFRYPFVIRPVSSGGGGGIRFIRDATDLQRIQQFFERDIIQFPRIIQQYISGLDYSCSVLSTGKTAKAISVQGQLIGIPSAGRNCDFAYCGNYLPSMLTSEIEQRIQKVSEDMCVALQLQGSVGFDFIVDQDQNLWLMEINPRIQGTLEMLELAGDISITEQHIRSTNGELLSELPSFKPVVKMLVYARHTGFVPNLSDNQYSYDRSPSGIMVIKGDPICTLIITGRNLRVCYEQTAQTVARIQNDITRK
jgi:predicted ATP-grasp superfamily ATP-dependent carboligase